MQPMSIIEARESRGASGDAVTTYFLWGAGLCLTLAGIGKLLTSLGSARLLATHDPIVGIEFRHLMVGIAILELTIAYLCLLTKFRKLATILIAWLASSFWFYRIGLWWMSWEQPCGCLGRLTDFLHISPQMADGIVKGLLLYLLIGSYGLLAWRWRQQRRSCSPPP